jgi:membrane protease subunit (stomatin/prohibitin family)
MKKHLAILFCAVFLGAAYCSVTALGIEDQLRAQGTYQQKIEDEIAVLRDKQAATQRRIAQLQQPATRSRYGEQEIKKQINHEKRTLSQLKRRHARLLLRQAEQLAQ